MIWIKMLWIRLFLSCLLFESAAGSLAWAVIMCRKRLWGENDYFFALAVRKAALLLYAVPVTFAYVYLSRFGFRPLKGYYVIKGEFVSGMVPGMYPFFGALGILWVGGVLIFLYRYISRSTALYRRMRENREVRCKDSRKVFLEYQERFPKARLFLYENRTLCSPVSVRRGGKHMILLPDKTYTEKELRMVLEHEVNHIIFGDLRWRMFGVAMMCVHWFNPVVYRQFRDLVRYQETVCDLRSSMEKPWYTKKEYAMLLAAQADPDLYLPQTSAFAEKKNDLIRRIEIMVKVKEFERTKNRGIAAGCACLLGISLIPSVAFASAGAKLQETWLHAGETEIEDEPQNWGDESLEEHGMDDGSVTEIYASDTGNTNKRSSVFVETVSKKTRLILNTVQMSKGDTIIISAKCSDKNITYRIGIKNNDTNTYTWIEGEGDLTHTFTIKTSGSYSAYVENRSSQSMDVEGSVIY